MASNCIDIWNVPEICPRSICLSIFAAMRKKIQAREAVWVVLRKGISCNVSVSIDPTLKPPRYTQLDSKPISRRVLIV